MSSSSSSSSSADRNIEHLRFLSKFYTNLIETKRIQMNIAEKDFLMDRSNMRAYDEWTLSRIKIGDYYENWLQQLMKCNKKSFDDVENTMYSMMISDCYWFLAKINRPPIKSRSSNYSQACEAIESIFGIMSDTLNSSNPFYQHILGKYERLVNDYRNAIGEHTISGASKHVPMGMTCLDVLKCREAIENLKYFQEFQKKPKLTRKSSKNRIVAQLADLSRIMLRTFI